jgi:hypothetical protein
LDAMSISAASTRPVITISFGGLAHANEERTLKNSAMSTSRFIFVSFRPVVHPGCAQLFCRSTAKNRVAKAALPSEEPNAQRGDVTWTAVFVKLCSLPT